MSVAKSLLAVASISDKHIGERLSARQVYGIILAEIEESEESWE